MTLQKEGITTVQLKVTKRVELHKIGDIHRETYDDIIQTIDHFMMELEDS